VKKHVTSAAIAACNYQCSTS